MSSLHGGFNTLRPAALPCIWVHLDTHTHTERYTPGRLRTVIQRLYVPESSADCLPTSIHDAGSEPR